MYLRYSLQDPLATILRPPNHNFRIIYDLPQLNIHAACGRISLVSISFLHREVHTDMTIIDGLSLYSLTDSAKAKVHANLFLEQFLRNSEHARTRLLY